MTKALTRLEAESYLVKYVTEGYKGMLESLTDDELVALFQNTTGQGLILPAVQQGVVVSAAGDRIEIPRNQEQVKEEDDE